MSDFQAYIRNRVSVAPSGCWVWQLSCDPDGYGYGCFQQRRRKAHRLSYEAFKGPIPDGLQIDHLCRVRNCVNPDHLEAVTCGENIRRGETGGRLKAECKRGHSFAEHGFRTKRGVQLCRECTRIRSKATYARHRATVCAKQRAKYHARKEAK